MKKKLFIIFMILFPVLPFTSYYGYGFFSKNPPPPPQSSKTKIELNLKKHVYILAHTIGERHIFNMEKLEEAKKYIAEEFKKCGYQVNYQKFYQAKKEASHIIARLPDAQQKDIIVIGAHYDSAGNTMGADDNASAVAGMLELACQLSTEKEAKHLEFVAFVNEERSFIKTKKMGSIEYVKKIKKENKDVRYAVIFETIGYYKDSYFSQKYPLFVGFFYPNKGNFITVAGNTQSADLTKEIQAAILENSYLPAERIAFNSDYVRGLSFSDHSMFWELGYKAVMLTDTAFYRNPNYHRPTDTYDTLDYYRMAELVKGMKAFIKKAVNTAPDR